MYFEILNENGRKQFHKNFILLTNKILSQFYYCYLSTLKRGVSLLLLPTIAIGCSAGELTADEEKSETQIITKSFSHFTEGGSLDILVFEDDRMKRLDAYQRIEHFEGSAIYPTSTGGEKIFFLIYNSRKERYSWHDINTYGTFRKMSSSLEDEQAGEPVMAGYGRCTAGEGSLSVTLRPLSSMVILESLKCDFSGTSYSGESICDLKAYLTNVNAECSLTAAHEGQMRIINAGMLNSYDIAGFSDKSIVVQSLGTLTDRKTISQGNRFLCYRNSSDKSRRTRLVLEGKVQGHTYYWPVEVGSGEGVRPDITYSYDIIIRRKGTHDPDILIEKEEIDVICNIKPWTEKEDYSVRF